MNNPHFTHLKKSPSCLGYSQVQSQRVLNALQNDKMTKFDYQEYTQPQHLEIAFQVPRREKCTATINVKPSDDPMRDGQHLLDLPYPPESRKGFPAIDIKVNSPVSRGYAAMYGWIQIVAEGNRDEKSGALPANLSSAPWEMDPIPITQDLNTPFTWFGVEPSLFDGPSRNNDVKQLDWVSRSFLCYLEDSVGNGTTKSLRPLPIFVVEWGFWIDEGRPHVKQLKRPDVAVWNDHLDLFKTHFPTWNFSTVDA